MPALGMAQDTGLIVSWAKNPGDPVTADDVLLEVETDKSTMEVPAGHDGYLAELRAAAGEDVPVGQVIAVITENEPAQTISRRFADGGDAATEPAAPREPPATTPEPEPLASPPESAPAAVDGRILASPKTRRLAIEEGLDLGRLVEAGHPQPFHVRDLEALRRLPAATRASTETVAPVLTVPGEIVARVDAEALDALAAMLEETEAPGPVRPRIWAAFAAASLAAAEQAAAPLLIRVEAGGEAHHFADPHRQRLSVMSETELGDPALIVRDLSATRIVRTRLMGDAVPALAIVRAGADLKVHLIYPTAALDPSAAVRFIETLAARLAQPLNHIL